MTTRRDLLKLAAGIGTGLLLDHRLVLAEPRQDRITKPIPSTGERIPVIGLGSAQTFNLAPGDASYREAQEVVRLFHEHGGTVIDTSPTYQRSELFLGETLREFGLARDVFVATKVNVGAAGRAAAVQQMEQSLRTYGRDSLDLIQVWNLGGSIRELTAAYLRDHMDALQEWKAAGRIRYLGITTSRDPQYADVEAAMREYTLDFVQLDYSIGDRIPEQRLLPLARERNIAILANRPFTTGNLFSRVRGRPLPDWAGEFDCSSWAQFFLKFVVSHPAVTCVIPATSNPNHLRDNMGAGLGRLPDEPTRRRMITVFESL